MAVSCNMAATSSNKLIYGRIAARGQWSNNCAANRAVVMRFVEGGRPSWAGQHLIAQIAILFVMRLGEVDNNPSFNPT